MNIAIALCIVVVLFAAGVYAVLETVRDDIKASINPQFALVTTLLREQFRHGKTMAEAAPVAWAKAGPPQMYEFIAYDGSANLVFRTRSAETLLSTLLYDYIVYPNSLYGDARFSQGRVFFDVKEDYLAGSIAKAAMRQLPFALAILAFAAPLSWLVAQRATLPLRELAADLRAFGRGDLVPKDLARRRDIEMDAVDASYNDAVERAKKALSERAAANDNMRTFISDAGHELKTPLTIVMGYIDALAEGLVASPEDHRQILRKTLNECRRMRGTIEKLIELARLEQQEPDIGMVDVAAVARDVGDSMRALAPQLKVEAPLDGEALAFGNADEIREAIVIAVDNALKYGKGCPVDVTVSRHADVVAVEIADSGPGMTPEDQQRAFERFYRGSAAVDVAGTGLGLAVAKRAVERANGRVALNSEQGRGTAVSFYLHAAERAATDQDSL
ncbi:MAG TPA: HAMP domain-containing sensor histidine kinase [Candidatus Acidoferrum sp.]|nr:HAMP domain-containing sensor histidine kinase [Candidatus Acidoferrum sp.]